VTRDELPGRIGFMHPDWIGVDVPSALREGNFVVPPADVVAWIFRCGETR